MDKVVLITGASSGIGLETAKLFQTKNWKVAATMREPEKAVELQKIVDIECIRLDVTDIASIKTAIAATLEKFGRIDAVVNNAGYAVLGAFEAATPEQIERQFQTNVFGLMNVCREILPYFREQKRGYIVNIASIGGRMTFPLYSLYHATKWAVEGFSESLQYELAQFNIRVKVIEPGPIRTDFYDRSLDFATKPGLTAYNNYVNTAHPNMLKAGESATGPLVVAKKVYKAATDSSFKIRYPVGGNGPVLLFIRWLLPLSWFSAIVRSQVEKGFKK